MVFIYFEMGVGLCLELLLGRQIFLGGILPGCTFGIFRINM